MPEKSFHFVFKPVNLFAGKNLYNQIPVFFQKLFCQGKDPRSHFERLIGVPKTDSRQIGREVRQNAVKRLFERKIGCVDVGLNKRSEEHTSELQSQFHLVCRLLLEKIK